MLGIRIDAELQRKLESISRQTGRSRSDVAREALRRYVDAHDLTKEAHRQSLAASATADAEPELVFDDRGWAP